MSWSWIYRLTTSKLPSSLSFGAGLVLVLRLLCQKSTRQANAEDVLSTKSIDLDYHCPRSFGTPSQSRRRAELPSWSQQITLMFVSKLLKGTYTTHLVERTSLYIFLFLLTTGETTVSVLLSHIGATLINGYLHISSLLSIYDYHLVRSFHYNKTLSIVVKSSLYGTSLWGRLTGILRSISCAFQTTHLVSSYNMRTMELYK